MKKRNVLILRVMMMFVIIFLEYYWILPPINLSSPAFWFFLILIGVTYYLTSIIQYLEMQSNIIVLKKPERKMLYIPALVVGVFALIILVNLFQSPVLNAKSYANRISIDEKDDFSKEIEPVNFDALPLLDKASSQKLGDRVMGQMPELVSQFTVSDLYTQINYNNKIVRVTPLEYASVIKYFTNRKEGVKGYITVNSVTGESELVKLKKGMRYMPSALFNEKLERKLRFSYPTEIFGEPNFEIDNEGNPYWVVPTIKYSGVGLKKDISGVIILDPITGSSKKYDSKNIPTWIDQVYPASLIMEQTDDWGKYKNGFLNSIFGQKDVVLTTTGYNYTVMKDDVYMYTGITSAATDQSILGFILCNLRTKETHFYTVPGAEETSAMASAKGQVQQMNYESTFPLLINLNNKPTYLVSLKDKAGLVKMYGFVDVEDYQKVVVTDASEGIVEAGRRYLGNNDIDSENMKANRKIITIATKESAILDGTTYYYYVDTEGNRYQVSLKVDKTKLPFIQVGDSIDVNYKQNSTLLEITKIF